MSDLERLIELTKRYTVTVRVDSSAWGTTRTVYHTATVTVVGGSTTLTGTGHATDDREASISAAIRQVYDQDVAVRGITEAWRNK